MTTKVWSLASKAIKTTVSANCQNCHKHLRCSRIKVLLTVKAGTISSLASIPTWEWREGQEVNVYTMPKIGGHFPSLRLSTDDFGT